MIQKSLNWWYWSRSKLIDLIRGMADIFPVPHVHPVYHPGPNPVYISGMAKVILTYNNTNACFSLGDPFTNKIKGVVIHRIDAKQAQEIADIIEQCCREEAIPPAFVCACLAVESVMDPMCQNGNLGPGESNAGQNNNLAGYDMGICQLKLKYLVGNEGIKTVQEAAAFALDPKRAIPYFCKVMCSKMEWATGIVKNNTSSAPDPRFNDPWILATGAYNFGNDGMLKIYNSGQFPTHCTSVMSDTKYFANVLL